MSELKLLAVNEGVFFVKTAIGGVEYCITSKEECYFGDNEDYWYEVFVFLEQFNCNFYINTNSLRRIFNYLILGLDYSVFRENELSLDDIKFAINTIFRLFYTSLGLREAKVLAINTKKLDSKCGLTQLCLSSFNGFEELVLCDRASKDLFSPNLAVIYEDSLVVSSTMFQFSLLCGVSLVKKSTLQELCVGDVLFLEEINQLSIALSSGESFCYGSILESGQFIVEGVS